MAVKPLIGYADEVSFLDADQKKISAAYSLKGRIVLDQRVKEHIEKADWHEITIKLASYANNRARSVFKIRDSMAVLPMGFSVESVVQEVIRKFLDGTRKWNPDKVDLLGFLMGAIKSEISHLIGAMDNQMTDRGCVPEDMEGFPDGGLNPEQILIEKERHNIIESVNQRLIEEAEADSEYGMIALCIMQGITKPADIAREAGLDLKKVYSLKKRWQRGFEKILHEVVADLN